MTRCLFIGGIRHFGERIRQVGQMGNGLVANCFDLWPFPDEPVHGFNKLYHEFVDRQLVFDQLDQGQYDAVYFSSRSTVIADYLRLAQTGSRTIATEIPLFRSLKDARKAEVQTTNGSLVWRHIDPFAYRPVVRWLAGQPLDFFIGGPPLRVSSWQLDSDRPGQPAGSLWCQMIHNLNLTRLVLPGFNIEVEDAYAARYNGCPYKRDTFCFLRAKAGPVRVLLTAARCFPCSAEGMHIEGPHASLVIDLATNTVKLVKGESPPVVIWTASEDAEDAHLHIARRFTGGDGTLGMRFDEVLVLLELLETTKRYFQQPLPQYVDYPRGWDVMKRELRLA